MVQRESIVEAVSVYGPSAKKFAELTLKDADAFFAGISEAIKRGDAEGLALSAHSLKSIMKQAGAAEAADISFELEKIGKSKDLSGAAEAAAKLKEVYNETRDVIESLT